MSAAMYFCAGMAFCSTLDYAARGDLWLVALGLLLLVLNLWLARALNEKGVIR